MLKDFEDNLEESDPEDPPEQLRPKFNVQENSKDEEESFSEKKRRKN